MAKRETIEADYRALSEFIANCPELGALEAQLGDFNLFQILRSEFSELKHSNVLAWLLDPKESHGLDDLFLQKWLMKVLHRAGPGAVPQASAVDVDSWTITGVEVRREWQNIDLLVLVEVAVGDPWVICIENKVHSTQGETQLATYRRRVEREFPNPRRRIYFFLTKWSESPNDESYLPTDYADVHEALTESVEQRRQRIGEEPRVLIDNYIRLLQEKFMNQSDIAKMAATIYQNHKRAIDVINAHRPDVLKGQVLPRLTEMLRASADELGIVMGTCHRNYVRFLPEAWDQPGNRLGKAWPPSPYTVLFEIYFSNDSLHFVLTAGHPPRKWADHIQPLCEELPFRHLSNENRTGRWPRLYSDTVDVLEDPAMLTDVEEAAIAIYDWLKETLQSSEMAEIVQTIADNLQLLESLTEKDDRE